MRFQSYVIDCVAVFSCKVDCLIHLHCAPLGPTILNRVLFCVSHWEHQWSRGYASQLHAKFSDMQARPNVVASLRCQENQQNSYIARLIVRLEAKLSSLGRAAHFL